MEKFSIKKRLKSFTYAWKGIKGLVSGEHNAWIHLTAATLAVAAGVAFGITRMEWVAVLLCIGGVIAAEAFNTAIERLVDLVSPKQHPVAGKVKDLAAGAVLVAALTSAIVGGIIFLPYLTLFFLK
ncbi:MAG: diacylglycerol kinase family protein [Bacteroides sp.]